MKLSREEVSAVCAAIRADFQEHELLPYVVSPCGTVAQDGDAGCFCSEFWQELLPKASYEAIILPSRKVLEGVPRSILISSLFPYWRAALLRDGEKAIDIMETNSLLGFARTMSVLGEEGDPYMAVKKAVGIVRACGGLRTFESIFGRPEQTTPVGGVIN